MLDRDGARHGPIGGYYDRRKELICVSLLSVETLCYASDQLYKKSYNLLVFK